MFLIFFPSAIPRGLFLNTLAHTRVLHVVSFFGYLSVFWTHYLRSTHARPARATVPLRPGAAPPPVSQHLAED
eukprot:1441515-Pleurochrysis_carterae.AAC.1